MTDTSTLTVYQLIGKIGMENLSSNAKKRLSKLNELDQKVTDLETAYNEADDKSKKTFKKKVDDAKDYLENYEEEFKSFLEVEHDDIVKARQEQKEREEAEAKAEEERLAQEEAVRKAQEEAQAQAQADEEAKAEEERLAQEEAERKAQEEAQAQAQAQAQQQPPAPANQPEKKNSGSLVGTIIVGGIVFLASWGAINYFKNK